MKNCIRYSLIMMLCTICNNSYSQTISLKPFVIVNDTITAMLDSVFSDGKGAYNNRKISIGVSKSDSITYVTVSIANKKGLYINKQSEYRPLGYVKYNQNTIFIGSSMNDYVLSSKDLPCLPIPLKAEIPTVDDVEEWHFIINRNQRKVYFVDHIAAW